MNFEQSLLSAVFKSPRAINKIDLNPKDFSNGNFGFLYQAILDVSKSTPVDIVTVSDHLKKKTGQDWVRLIGKVASSSSSVENIKTYCDHIKSESIQRQARFLCNNAALSSDDVDINSLISDLMRLNKTNKNYLKNSKQMLKESFQKIDDIYNQGGGLTGMSTGYCSLNDKLGGWHNSDLIVVGARPAMGKTALLISMMLRCAGKPLMISAEMASGQIGDRILSQQSKVSATKIRRAQLENHDWNCLSNATDTLAGKEIWVYDKPGVTLQDIYQVSRALRHDEGINLILVDYLQKIRGTNRSNRVDEIEEIAIGLKDLARELDCPVIALAQVNRECEKRNDKRPIMSDLKGAGAIEQEADSIAFLYRDSVYNQNQNDQSGVAELRWEKNRHGPTGLINLHWDCQTMSFSDIDENTYNYQMCG